MEILSKNLKRCDKCKRLCGHIEEKYNGVLPVFCRCDLVNSKHSGASPSAVSMSNDLLMWTPTTDHKNEKGEWGHVPYFVGFGY